MYKPFFSVTTPKSSKTSCFNCHHQISKQEIRISYKKYDHHRYYHLNCFDPAARFYLKDKNVDILLKSPSDQSVFKDWLLVWNSQFFPLDKETQVKVTSKRVLKTKSSKTSQIFSKVFEFLSIDDLVNFCQLVCKDFYHAAWSQELWKKLYLREFKAKPKGNNARLAFVQENFERCLVCKERKDGLKRNELLQRNLCRDCKDRGVGRGGDFKKIIKREVEKEFGMSLDSKAFDFKSFNGLVKGNYRFYFRKVLERVRKENRAEVLIKLREVLNEEHHIIRFIKGLDLKSMNYFISDEIIRQIDCRFIDISKEIYHFIRNREMRIRCAAVCLEKIKDDILEVEEWIRSPVSK